MLKQSLVYIALSSFIHLSCLAYTAQATTPRSGFIHHLSPRHDASHSSTATSQHHRRTNQESTYETREKAFYSSLVAIGASFTDDGHPRFAKWNTTLHQYYPYSLYDDAYGGSVIKNDLGGTGANSPAAIDQIATYLSDLEHGIICGGKGRVLHYFNSGINPVGQIWSNAMSQNFTKKAKINAVDSLEKNMQAYATAIDSIALNEDVKESFAGVDLLLVGIPPLEIVPHFASQVLNTTSEAAALTFLKQLTKQYNSELKTISSELRKRHKHSRVFFYDFARLWYSLQTFPESYGLAISPITTPCFEMVAGTLCKDPGSYLYWDTLHPTTVIHQIMAEEINSLVLGITKEE
ncbi:hypothetical protein JCM5353_006667 [Sporobolomyces roseus]